MITEEKITDIFINGKVEKNVTIAPLFLKIGDVTYLAKGTMRSNLACPQCAFYGKSCPRDLNSNLLCTQVETAGRVTYFEEC
jgi:hypothetical protein